jgi:hypothetical protein
MVLGERKGKMKMKTELKKCNGWTNYATWRINLEIFDGCVTPEGAEGQEVDHEYCKDLAEEIIFSGYCGNEIPSELSLMQSYASAFISDVNWHEIAEHINDGIEEGK